MRFLYALSVLLIACSDSGLAKSKGKTSLTKLKCSGCFAVVSVMRGSVEYEWKSKIGETILVGKRNKKTKMSYVDSELAVQEAVDRVCGEDQYNKYNVTLINGVPRYMYVESDVGNQEYQKHLSSICQSLLADFENDIVQFFYTKKGTSEIQAAERAICADVSKMCTVKETDEIQASAFDGPDAMSVDTDPLAEGVSAQAS